VKDTLKGSAEEGEQQQQQQQLRVPVAKVLLSPWTGRRHQLRVHVSRIAGCPILGDVAYTKGSDDRGVIGSRMCLHAKELSIPLIGSAVKTFTAQDP
jgi:23S rRNA-/tRNA-specific pseudouridylate synthase